MDQKRIKAVIYDGDGMVINSEMYYVHLINEFGSKAEILNDFFSNEFQLCLIGKADLREAIIPYLEKLGWSESVDTFIKHWFDHESKVDHDILETIDVVRKKGISCFLASNQEKYRTEYMEKELGFKDIFDGIFFSSQIGYLKPQNEFFSYIADYLKKEKNIEKNEVLFWDDREKNVEAARDFGFTSEHFKNFYTYLQTARNYAMID